MIIKENKTNPKLYKVTIINHKVNKDTFIIIKKLKINRLRLNRMQFI